ncbi:hypothetical protein SAMN05421749_103321 [Acinetobacter marinus]|uniref:Uncharacterized protein n=1 Tax=Acinetobacter marinus TaxID=281375 RepID=A0A1G6JDA3_9GAMM|nr:hypothetical protein [Acinetobacter marinus]SDC16784.1 hypothetical protein SAMN05421749_103321 [Acinetobacter marinus]
MSEIYQVCGLGLSEEEIEKQVAALREAGIAYEITGGTRTVAPTYVDEEDQVFVLDEGD